MNTQIVEVQAYFKNKILTFQFEIVAINEFTIDILIDGEYKFVFWKGNIDMAHTMKLYNRECSFMNILFTDEESERIHSYLAPILTKAMKEELLAQKLKEVEELRNQINAIT